MFRLRNESINAITEDVIAVIQLSIDYLNFLGHSIFIIPVKNSNGHCLTKIIEAAEQKIFGSDILNFETTLRTKNKNSSHYIDHVCDQMLGDNCNLLKKVIKTSLDYEEKSTLVSLVIMSIIKSFAKTGVKADIENSNLIFKWGSFDNNAEHLLYDEIYEKIKNAGK